ncbi:MAG: hypothetical protein ISN28_06090 [Ectothiorhodospiraceae bacterium AqS1]|nr:hypothetical protein [Ectothiorhodospiraceae bacterium AqS1]
MKDPTGPQAGQQPHAASAKDRREESKRKRVGFLLGVLSSILAAMALYRVLKYGIPIVLGTVLVGAALFGVDLDPGRKKELVAKQAYASALSIIRSHCGEARQGEAGAEARYAKGCEGEVTEAARSMSIEIMECHRPSGNLQACVKEAEDRLLADIASHAQQSK